jgi:hypothetical protein
MAQISDKVALGLVSACSRPGSRNTVRKTRCSGSYFERIQSKQQLKCWKGNGAICPQLEPGYAADHRHVGM